MPIARLLPLVVLLVGAACTAAPRPSPDPVHPAATSAPEPPYRPAPNALGLAADTPLEVADGSSERVSGRLCLVSGAELGSMGEPVVIDHEGHTVRLCCSACIEEFRREPAAYLSSLATTDAQH